jgi:hypothetical protein
MSAWNVESAGVEQAEVKKYRQCEEGVCSFRRGNLLAVLGIASGKGKSALAMTWNGYE